MATLTPQELRAIRNMLEKRVNGSGVTWTKDQVNAAAQAIENRLVASQGILNNDIESAAPGVFTVHQKKMILAHATLRFAKAETV